MIFFILGLQIYKKYDKNLLLSLYYFHCLSFPVSYSSRMTSKPGGKFIALISPFTYLALFSGLLLVLLVLLVLLWLV